jgi:hypothetical protein
MPRSTFSVYFLIPSKAGEDESVASTVNFELPALAGDPEMTPADERLSPAGRTPVVMLQL